MPRAYIPAADEPDVLNLWQAALGKRWSIETLIPLSRVV